MCIGNKGIKELKGVLFFETGVPGVSGGKVGSADLTSTLLNPQITDFLNDQGYNNTRPKAYLNWVLFDEQFKYDSANSGAQQVGGSGMTPYNLANLPVRKNGYLYIYVSNETNNIDVFFDNLQVTHVGGVCWRRVIIIRLG